MSLSRAGSGRVRKALGLALIVSSAHAYASDACPLSLPGETIATLRPPAGWRAHVQRELRLYTAGLVAGEPSAGGYLKPLRTRQTRKGDTATVISTWDLSLPRGEVWLYCGFGDAVEVFRLLANDASRCVMTSAVRGRAVRAIELVCE